jgi:hypothetical protein
MNTYPNNQLKGGFAMGGGSWSTEFYRDREEERRRSGASAFAYNAKVSTSSRSEQKTHANLDPMGVVCRESLDSEDHPESNAIAVFFDVTGSMRDIPALLQQKLPNLMDTLNNSGYIKDPQVFFGAVGDSVTDRGSLQVGQFESDNRVTTAFENMWLEGGGGGTSEESYQNAMYFAARHMALDCVTKRNKKGYLFLIGDEMPYMTVRQVEINRLMGEGTLQSDIPIKALLEELQTKFNVFMIIPLEGSHGRDIRIQKVWRDLLSQNVILSDNMNDICEIITMAVGIGEGADLDKARTDLQTHGSTTAAVNRAAASLRDLAPSGSDAPRNLRL